MYLIFIFAIKYFFNIFINKHYFSLNQIMGIGDWGLGIGEWGLGIGPNPQSPIPNPQSPIPNPQKKYIYN